MAWRPTQYLLEGELDNTTPGKVTGWMRFAGLKKKVTFDLEGNFHRDIRGARIHFHGPASERNGDAGSYMDGFALHQSGQAGDITAGRPPRDYLASPYYVQSAVMLSSRRSYDRRPRRPSWRRGKKSGVRGQSPRKDRRRRPQMPEKWAAAVTDTGAGGPRHCFAAELGTAHNVTAIQATPGCPVSIASVPCDGRSSASGRSPELWLSSVGRFRRCGWSS